MKLSRILSPIKNSPNLRSLIDELEVMWQNEQDKRLDFYNWVTPDKKAEFIGGEIIVHSPVVKKHNVITTNLILLLVPYIQTHALGFLGVEKIMCRFDRNDYEPDLCFFKKEKSATFLDDQTIFPIPDFIVEILSPSTESRDRGIKKEDFQLNGVQEYWIIDPDINTIEQYLINEDGEYNDPIIFEKGIIECSVLHGLNIDVKAIFK
ncbi:MAG: Uma2 family endonuclease [Saprospiraceae bacterium]|nr:Uma2 family endonuclease [Saprospiraceae bacterium]HMS66684.1 Uma2 family endonuclease [Saprospiraceae bacterium]